jgi:hypothetical protein
MPKKTYTYKLGAIELQPQHSPFRFDIRMPGWHPDGDDKGSGRVDLFIEEAIKISNNKFEPFPPAFAEATADPRGWITGEPLPATINPNPFSRVILELANLVREYNAALYRLRRLHFYVHSGHTPGTDPMPGANPDDPSDVLPEDSGISIEDLVKAAERRWRGATKALSKFIEKPKHTPGDLRIVAADMVEVNSYVVSMRVIADTTSAIKLRKRARILQIGGSSSSHVYISSAFSSPAPRPIRLRKK